MAYKCLECGHIFERGEEDVWRESRGEFWGQPCYEEVSGCPLCRGGFRETVQCASCGGEHLEDELHGGVCDECINGCRHNFGLCDKITSGEKVKIKISGLIASILDEGDVEAILRSYISTRMPDVECCSPYIDEDIDWFGKMLAKEVKKNEH